MNELKYILGYGVIGVVFLTLVVFAMNKVDEYDLTAEVYAVDTCDNVVTFETADGHLYDTDVADVKLYEVGDKWKVTFKDYENADPTDDAIVNIKVKVE